MRAGTEAALARVVRVFGAARPHHAYLFANRRANRMKVLVHDGIGIWLSAVNHAQDEVLCFDTSFLPLVQAVHARCPAVKKWIALCDADMLPADSGIPNLLSYEAWISEQSDCYEWPRTSTSTRPSSMCYTISSYTDLPSSAGPGNTSLQPISAFRQLAYVKLLVEARVNRTNCLRKFWQTALAESARPSSNFLCSPVRTRK